MSSAISRKLPPIISCWLALVVITGTALWCGNAQAQEAIWGKAVHEQVIVIPNQGDTLQLETTIFRPSGKGPFPVMIINHGKARGNPAWQPRDRSSARVSVSVSGGADFIERALKSCRDKSPQPCSLYLVNHSVVQSQP
ncbi:MAG: hypothetical protein JO174_09540 [Herbaspirillum sp.]|nr:hypothetical protein [Herbaspirillum sp.]